MNTDLIRTTNDIRAFRYFSFRKTGQYPTHVTLTMEGYASIEQELGGKFPFIEVQGVRVCV
jgi:hypothetical protein